MVNAIAPHAGEEFRDDVRKKLPPDALAALLAHGVLEGAQIRRVGDTLARVFAQRQKQPAA